MKTKRKSVIPRLIKECKKIAFPLIISSLITLLTVAAGLYAPDVLGNLTQKIYDASSGSGNAELNEFLRYAAILATVYLAIALGQIVCKIINCNTNFRY